MKSGAHRRSNRTMKSLAQLSSPFSLSLRGTKVCSLLHVADAPPNQRLPHGSPLDRGRLDSLSAAQHRFESRLILCWRKLRSAPRLLAAEGNQVAYQAIW